METANSLTLEEEGVLKKVLLQDTFDLELHRFSKSSDPYDCLVNDTLLLRFLFGTLLGDDEPHPSVRKFILKLPTILSLLHKATKKKDATSSYFSILVDLLLRTPNEKIYAKEVGHAQRFSALMEDNVSVRKVEGEADFLYSATQDARKLLIDSSMEIYKEVAESQEGTDMVFNTISRCKTIEDLPESYRGIFKAMMTATLPRTIEIVKDPGKTATRKKMYHNTPRRTILSLLSITNPFKMVSSLSSLFLARPLGSHNLLQKMIETSTEYGRTTNALKDAKKACSAYLSKYIDRIEDYAKTDYLPLGDLSFSEEDNAKEEKESFVTHVDITEQRKQLTEALAKSPMAKNELTTLKPTDISMLFRVLRLEKRKRDKLDVIDLFGEPEMVEVIKDLLPMICVPLGDIYASVGVSDWVSETFKWLKCIVTTGEKCQSQKSPMTADQIRKELYNGFYSQEEAHYRFLRNIISADRQQTLKRVFRWIYEKFQVGDGIIFDLNPLVFSAGPMDPAVRDELEKIVAFEKFRNHLWKIDFKKAQELVRPEHPAITRILLKPFLVQLESLPVSKPFRAQVRAPKVESRGAEAILRRSNSTPTLLRKK